MAAASIVLKVLHSAKRSVARCCTRAPLPVSSAATPSRPPTELSSAASCASADVACCAFADQAVQALASGSADAASRKMRRLAEGFICLFFQRVDGTKEIVGAPPRKLQRQAAQPRLCCIGCNGTIHSTFRLNNFFGATIFNLMVELDDERLDAVFHALADSTRRTMLQLLAQG